MPSPILSTVTEIALSAIPIVFAVTLHEIGHGWVARQLGDPTAAKLGRLSPNPLRHIDPIGTVLLPLLLILTKAGFIFGWAKPVPINWRNLRSLRRDMALVALAGPGANVLQVLFWVSVVWVALPNASTSPYLASSLVRMADIGLKANIALVVFNLIPLPPLDGSRVVSSVLPRSLAIKYNGLEPYGLFIIMGLLMLGWMDDIISPLFRVGRDLAYALLPG